MPQTISLVVFSISGGENLLKSKSIYGDNFKVVEAEAPATTKVALLILLNVGGNKCSLDLATVNVEPKIFN